MIVNVEDFTTSTIINNFYECFKFIDEGISKGGCLIHCMAGCSRSVTVLIAYLMYKKDITLREAFVQVKRKKKNIEPNETFRHELVVYSELLGEKKFDEKNCIVLFDRVDENLIEYYFPINNEKFFYEKSSKKTEKKLFLKNDNDNNTNNNNNNNNNNSKKNIQNIFNISNN
jgi:hypothetical protein